MLTYSLTQLCIERVLSEFQQEAHDMKTLRDEGRARLQRAQEQVAELDATLTTLEARNNQLDTLRNALKDKLTEAGRGFRDWDAHREFLSNEEQNGDVFRELLMEDIGME
jgi:uncharacterized coiled-coil DUF342 family protein